LTGAQASRLPTHATETVALQTGQMRLTKEATPGMALPLRCAASLGLAERLSHNSAV